MAQVQPRPPEMTSPNIYAREEEKKANRMVRLITLGIFVFVCIVLPSYWGTVLVFSLPLWFFNWIGLGTLVSDMEKELGANQVEAERQRQNPAFDHVTIAIECVNPKRQMALYKPCFCAMVLSYPLALVLTIVYFIMTTDDTVGPAELSPLFVLIAISYGYFLAMGFINWLIIGSRSRHITQANLDELETRHKMGEIRGHQDGW